MTGISSVTVNNMVDDTGDGISGTPYNKTFMQSLINDLIATALPLDGSVAMTGALQELFIGLIRKLNPNGTAHIYEYAGGLLATTTSPTGNGFQQAWTYNVPLATTTVPPTVNSWGGRDITDFCVLVQFLDTGVFEIWFAPSATAGAAPVWTKMYAIDLSTGLISTMSANIPSGAINGQHLYGSRYKYINFSRTSLPPGTTQAAGASTFSVLNNVYCLVPTSAGTPWITVDEFSRLIAAALTGTAAGYTNIRIGARVSWDVTNASAKFVGLAANTAGTTGVLITPNGTNAILCRTGNDAGTVNDQSIAQTWTNNTAYDLAIELLANTTAKFYFNGTLIATSTTNLPNTAVLAAGIMSFNTAGTQYVSDMYVAVW